MLIWGLAIASGLIGLMHYETAPGFAGTVLRDWPSASRISRSEDGAHLVMFAHPRCPCTRASMRELAQLMSDCRGQVNADVVFLTPPGDAQDWTNTDLWQAAQAIPGVRVMADEAGRERDLFGVATSGHLLLYRGDGKLMFSGGITAARGHSGDNTGRSAVTRLLNHGTADRTQTHIFGCPLHNPSTETRGTDCVD